jgi:hypothetical protein
MKTTHQFVCSSLVALVGLVAVNPARADQHQAIHEIENLAAHVRTHSREMANALRFGRFPHEFTHHLLGDLAAVGQAADHLRDTADDHDHPQHILADIRQLSPLVRQVVSHVRELNASIGWYGGGSSSLRNLNRLAAEMQQDMRELEFNARLLDAGHYHSPGTTHYRPVLTQPGPGIAFGPGGFSIGGSRFSIQFGR